MPRRAETTTTAFAPASFTCLSCSMMRGQLSARATELPPNLRTRHSVSWTVPVVFITRCTDEGGFAVLKKISYSGRKHGRGRPASGLETTGILRQRASMNSVTQGSEGRRSASVSAVGRVRRENQDAVLAEEELGLWLVADGMGGHAGGACASTIARDTIRDRISRGRDLTDAVMAAHHAIRAEQAEHPEYHDMGTTIVALLEAHGRYQVCWVGVSRAYRFCPGTSRLELLTRDHNVAGVLVASVAL